MKNARDFHIRRPIFSITRSLGALSKRWLDKNYPFRKKAVRRLIERSGFSDRAADKLLDLLFKQLTESKLKQLLRAEFRDPAVLDDFCKDPVTGHWHKAMGPELITHIFSGNVPNPAITSFIFGMLIKSQNVGKLSSKDEGFLDIYLESLKAFDKELGATNHLIGPNDRKSVSEFIKKSDLVVAYGNNQTLEMIRKQVPIGTPFFGYGHKVSFGIYTKEVLSPKNVEALAKKTAFDIWMMDQRGCLSPTLIYLERGGEVSPLIFSQTVARHLPKAGRWVTLFDQKIGDFPLSSPNKIIHFRSFKKAVEIYKSIAPYSGYLQAVALEAEAPRRVEIAKKLSDLGANRICRAGSMQTPPITWHHDGLPNLASWVKWTDLEN